MDRDLFLAVLAMDAYNRGPAATKPGINFGSGADNYSAPIGTATFALEKSETSSGFYAVAYRWGDEKIISYRGTDSNFGLATKVLSGDFVNGYGLAIGLPYSAQVDAAIDFFQEVSGTT